MFFKILIKFFLKKSKYTKDELKIIFFRIFKKKLIERRNKIYVNSNKVHTYLNSVFIYKKPWISFNKFEEKSIKNYKIIFLLISFFEI